MITREVERGGVVAIAGLKRGRATGTQEEVDRIPVALAGRLVQRGPVELVAGGDVSAGGYQNGNNAAVPSRLAR